MGDDRGTRVYIGNLGEKVKKEDIEGEFTKYGKLNSVWVAFNPPGFAFVEFENRNEAQKCCDLLNGSELFNSKLRVEISKGRPKNRRDGGGRRFDGPRRDFRGGSDGFRGRDNFRSSGGNSQNYREGAFRPAGRSNFGGRSSGGGGYANSNGTGRSFGGSGSRDGSRSFGSSGGFNRSSSGGRFRSRSPQRSRF